MDENIIMEEQAPVAADELAPIETESGIKKGLGRVKGIIKKIGTRNLIIAGSVTLIAAAVILNFVLFGNQAPTVGEGELLGSGLDKLGASEQKIDVKEQNDSYFASAQLSRKQTRDQALAVLKSVVDSSSADQVAKDQASLDISRITSEMEAEANIETLVKSKGFEDCIAVIGDGSASIIVRSDGLLPNELSQIKEIVWEQAGIDPVGIKIIEQAQT